MSMDDKQRAKKLAIARKATPGPWDYKTIVQAAFMDLSANAKFIAAFPPVVAIEVLTENAALVAKLNDMEVELWAARETREARSRGK